MGQTATEVLQLELFVTQSRVITSEVCCPTGLRLLDLLNESRPVRQTVRGDFLELAELRRGEHDDALLSSKTCVRKGAIQFAAVTEANAGRGAGTGYCPKGYPFVRKSRATVSLELPGYTLIGNVHCGPGQTTQDVLNDAGPFLPLTEVTIASEEGLYGIRPFVAVNKQQVISSREEPPG